LTSHHREFVLQAEDCSKHIGFERQCVAFWRLFRHEPRLGVNARTIDGHIHASETIDCEFDETLDVRRLANVAPDELRLNPKFAKLAYPILALPFLRIGDDDPGAFPRKGVGRGAADAAQASGNEYD